MTFQAPKGVSEYLPPRGALFAEVRDAFAESARRACYDDVETAVFEDTALFVRGVGESSDVVRKEMYSFADRGGRELTLRPEFTAGVLRAVLEHNLHKGALPVKVFTSGPAFRYERPQAGRYRQFYQFDLEAIGTEDPVVDAETIAVAWDAYQSLGLQQYTLLLNSLGDKVCRPVYREALQKFLRGLDLDDDTRQRIEINPLRVLDDKRPEVRAQTAGRAGDDRLPLRRVQGPPRRRARPAGRPRHPLHRRAPAGPRPRLLHQDHLRVRPRAARGPVRHRRRRPLRRAVGGDRRPAAARDRLRGRP